jgi:hypothetical protein
MPVNNRNQSPRPRMPMNLEDATAKSAYRPCKRQRGIRATERTARSRMLARAQPTKKRWNQRRTILGPPGSLLQPVAGR